MTLLLALLLGLLPGSRPLLAQPTHAFFGDSLVAVPPAVAQAYRRCCPEQLADSTHWEADFDRRAAKNHFVFQATGTHYHRDRQLADPLTFDTGSEFTAQGRPLYYARETVPDSLPWRARWRVRRETRQMQRDSQLPPDSARLYLLVAHVSSARRYSRPFYRAYFATVGPDGKLHQSYDCDIRRNGYRVPNPRFRP